MFLQVNGWPYHVKVYGDDHTETLLVLHGFTGAMANWQPFMKTWSADFRVIMVDMIGHGRTGVPTDISRYTMSHVVQDLAALLDQLVIGPVHLLGYSMGGRTALSFAVTYPDRVASLILESSSPGLATASERYQRRVKDEALADNIEAKGLSWFVAYWEGLSMFATQTVDVRRQLRQQRLRNHSVGLANSLRGMGTGHQPSVWSELHGLPHDVLLITGVKDEKFSNLAERMAELLPHADRQHVADAGHIVHAEKPEIFTDLVKQWMRQERMR